MKTLRSFLCFVFLLIILAGAAWLVATSVGLNFPELDQMLGDQWRRASIGGALALLVLIFLVACVPTRKKEKAISYEGDGGKVSVSVKAINTLLSRLSDEFAAIVNMKASTNPRDKSIQLDLTVKSGAKVLELSQALQERVRESMRDHLGISDLGPIKVYVREITPPENSDAKDREEHHSEWHNIPL